MMWDGLHIYYKDQFLFRAVMIEYNGVVKRINPDNATQQKSILKCLLTPDDKEKGFQTVKIVSNIKCCTKFSSLPLKHLIFMLNSIIFYIILNV